MMQQQKEQENIVMQHANLFEDNKDTQLTINLYPGWECPSSPLEENKKKEKEVLDQRTEENKKKKVPDQRSKDIPNQRLEESKKRKKNSRSKIGRKSKKIYRKIFGPNNI